MEDIEEFNPEEIIEEKISENQNDGVSYVTNNQNGMGNILSPQP